MQYPFLSLFLLALAGSNVCAQQPAPSTEASDACRALALQVREHSQAESLLWALDTRIQLIAKLTPSCPGLIDQEVAEAVTQIREVPSPAGRAKLTRAVLPFLIRQPTGVAHTLIAALPENERDGAYLRLIEAKSPHPADLLQLAAACTAAASFCPRSLNLAVLLASRTDTSAATALYGFLISSLPPRDLSVDEIESLFVTSLTALKLGNPALVREGLTAVRGVILKKTGTSVSPPAGDGPGRFQMGQEALRDQLDAFLLKLADVEQPPDFPALAARLSTLIRQAFNPAGGRAPIRNIQEGLFERELEPYRAHFQTNPTAPAVSLRAADTRGDVDLIRYLILSESKSLSTGQQQDGIQAILAGEQNASRTILRYNALKVAVQWSCALGNAGAALRSSNRLAQLLNEHFRTAQTPACDACDTVYMDGMDVLIRELNAANLLRPGAEGLNPSVAVRRLLRHSPAGDLSSAERQQD